MRQFIPSLLVLFLMLKASPLLAQRTPHQDPLTEILFPPEMLMRNAQEIGLDDQQKQFIQQRAEQMRQTFPDLQQDLQRQLDALAEMLHQDKPDAQQAAAQLDKVLDAERQIKKAQLELALTIRDQLTPDQFAKAKNLQMRIASQGRQNAEQPTARNERPAGGDIDWDKARQLYQKSQQGEKLTDEEQAYLDKAKAARARMNAPDQNSRRNPNRTEQSQPEAKDSTGLVPLTQLKDPKYKEMDGGLYGNGQNQPPEPQLKAALAAAAKITPLDLQGNPLPDGKVVLMSIGMSNTTMEFSQFAKMANDDPAKSSSLLIVDSAQGGKDAAAWANTDGSNSNPTWETADARLKAAGVSPLQVQAVWIKQAMMGPGRLGEFPDHAKVLQKDIETILNVAKLRYPNLKLAYLSSRIYAGYANTALNPEPYAYESAFSVRWVIQDQMSGEPAMNADPAKGQVKSPIVLWGPYLWADGVKGRELDKLAYTRDDLGADGTHPSPSGRQKVADLLLQFFKTDPTTAPWFIKSNGSAPVR